MASSRVPALIASKLNAFSHISRQLDEQQRLLGYVTTALPTALAGHAQYCVLSHKKLTIYTTAAVWASQLRFYSQTILDALITQQISVQTVQIKLLTETLTTPTAKNIRPNIPSLLTIDTIDQLGSVITDHELQQSLQRLSATLKRLAKQ